jgi:hypothetical protein
MGISRQESNSARARCLTTLMRSHIVGRMAKKKSVKRAARKQLSSLGDSAPLGIKPGPRKEVVEGPPPPRYTTHKVRAAWFQARASYPVREANVEKLISERTRVRPAAPTAASWVPVGPTNIGGGVRLCRSSYESDIVYIGSAGGGVWRSDDAGQTWISQWHDQPF